MVTYYSNFHTAQFYWFEYNLMGINQNLTLMYPFAVWCSRISKTVSCKTNFHEDFYFIKQTRMLFPSEAALLCLCLEQAGIVLQHPTAKAVQ